MDSSMSRMLTKQRMLYKLNQMNMTRVNNTLHIQKRPFLDFCCDAFSTWGPDLSCNKITCRLFQGKKFCFQMIQFPIIALRTQRFKLFLINNSLCIPKMGTTYRVATCRLGYGQQMFIAVLKYRHDQGLIQVY